MDWEKRKQSEKFANELANEYSQDKDKSIQNNPITFAEWCYLKGKADERQKIVERLENALIAEYAKEQK